MFRFCIPFPSRATENENDWIRRTVSAQEFMTTQDTPRTSCRCKTKNQKKKKLKQNEEN